MSQVRIANIGNFQKGNTIISKTKDFVSKLQRLESRLNKVKIPKTEGESNANFLKESIKSIKEYLTKLLGENYNFFQTHWSYLKKDIINSRRTSQKKEIIKNEIQYLKNYINNKKGIHWNETNHTDILYIYWHSKNDLEVIEELTFGLEFLDKEIMKLEKRTLLTNLF